MTEPTEARQDELAGKIAELVKRACVKYDGANHQDLLIKVHTDEILSLTVSSGGICPTCKGSKKTDNYDENFPYKVDCYACNGTGVVEKTLGEIIKEALK